ncbi:MAG: LemA family protein [Gammaproteobacteria bacterium]|nr:LemA family protein [Gammaproteobacteria bacterium]MDH3371109.1 LemA family protein [Gammaproteobacteria bacterium]
MEIFGWGLVAIIIGIPLLGVTLYNRLVNLRNQVKNAWRQIDVQLKRRHDLIPNLVETVKDYMSYEQETLEKVVQARNQAVGASNPEESIMAEGILGAALGKLFALMEAYPDLKANESVARLMEELSATENKISFSRQFYNDSVMALNNGVQAFPSNIIAGMFGFHPATYFEVPEAEAEVPKVDIR